MSLLLVSRWRATLSEGDDGGREAPLGFIGAEKLGSMSVSNIGAIEL